MLRVANVIEEGKLGGPQVRMACVAAALATRARTLIIMPRANSGRFRELCNSHKVTWNMLPLTRITREWRVALGYVLFSPLEIVRLYRLFRAERVDLVHASGGSWQVKAVIAAKLAGVPAIWHLNDTSMPAPIRMLFRLIQPLAAGFIFASHRSYNYYSLPDKIRPRTIIPAVVDTDRFVADGTEHGHEACSIHADCRVLGTVANISRVKDLETLVNAFGLLRQQGRNIRLVIVGAVFANQRSYQQRLVELARSLGVDDRIEWAGEQSDVRSWLTRVDVYVCSSRAESSPMAVWEAMAMARPVVSTDVGDVPCHVKEGESGFIVPVGDFEAMAERIEILLDDEELRKRCGIHARKIALDNFSVGKVAKATGDFYEEVLEYWRRTRVRGHGRKCGVKDE